MSKSNDGGSAFPSHGSMGEVVCEGMTLRDFFIAHAPAEPQSWFEPVVVKPSVPPKWRKIEDSMRAELAGYFDLGIQPRSIEGIAWLKDYRHAEYERSRYIQWPAAWADAMLAEREKADRS